MQSDRKSNESQMSAPWFWSSDMDVFQKFGELRGIFNHMVEFHKFFCHADILVVLEVHILISVFLSEALHSGEGLGLDRIGGLDALLWECVVAGICLGKGFESWHVFFVK